MTNIFLDDERNPRDVTWVEIPRVLWIVVRDIDEFKSVVQGSEHIENISFDHDLGEQHYPWNGSDYSDERTGYDCAKWLCEWCIENDKPLPNWTVHSMNPIGRENISAYLTNFKRVTGR